MVYYAYVRFARLAQLVEHMLDVHGVTGSSPVPRTREKHRNRKISVLFLLLFGEFCGEKLQIREIDCLLALFLALLHYPLETL